MMTKETNEPTEEASALPEVTIPTRNEWLGQALRKRRDRVSMSAPELGEKVGLHEQTIYAYEQGRITVSWDNVVAICHAVRASPSKLAALYMSHWYGPHQYPGVQSPAS